MDPFKGDFLLDPNTQKKGPAWDLVGDVGPPRANPQILYGALGFLVGVALAVIGLGELLVSGRLGLGVFGGHGGLTALAVLVGGPAIGLLVGVGIGAIRSRRG